MEEAVAGFIGGVSGSENILAFCDFGDLGVRGFERLPLSFR